MASAYHNKRCFRRYWKWIMDEWNSEEAGTNGDIVIIRIKLVRLLVTMFEVQVWGVQKGIQKTQQNKWNL